MRAVRGAFVADLAVQVVDAELGDFKRNALRARFLFVQADAGHLGGDKSGPGDHRIVHLERLEVAKQRVHRRIPSLVCRDVGELVRPGHVTRGINVGVQGLQERVGLHSLIGGNAQGLQAVAAQARASAYGAQQLVKNDALFNPAAQHHQHFVLSGGSGHALAAQRLVAGAYLHAIGLQGTGGRCRDIFVFAGQQALTHLHLRDL